MFGEAIGEIGEELGQDDRRERDFVRDILGDLPRIGRWSFV
jgi:hypothetical protein